MASYRVGSLTAIRIEKFGGMAPKLSNRLLPSTASAAARNARLLSGELRGIKEPERIHRFTSGTVKNVKRIYRDDDTPVWLGLSNPDSDIVKGPLVNDLYGRYYWTGEEAYVAYNSTARIENGDPPYRLGTPAPNAAATVVVSGGSGNIETRAYTYTFVNEWNEESAPAPVASISGFTNGSWDLSGLLTSAPDMTNRLGIDTKRIYRTVTGQATVAYYFVAEIDIADSTYSDTTTNAETVLNSVLDTFLWNLPPDSLQGLTAHPAGFLVAFDGEDLYFSERYRPHTWPVSYVISVEHKIVGLAIYNNMIAVLTRGQPYFIQGVRPENITPSKSQSAEPCLTKSSIAATLQGVLYASPNGLVIFNEAGPQVVTSQIMSIEEWDTYSPSTMRGAQYGQQYLGYYSSSYAIKYSPSEPFGVFVELDKFDAVDNVVTDDATGELWLLRGNDVYQWEPPTGPPLYYTWYSKVFDFTRPINFGAFMLKAEGETIEAVAANVALYTAYNAAVFGADPPAALHPINSVPLGASIGANVDVGTTPAGIGEIPQFKYPLGGGPIYNLVEFATRQTQIALTVYADGREIFNREVSPSVCYRMPAGFKAHTWQFRLVGNSNVYSLAVAETPKELENV